MAKFNIPRLEGESDIDFRRRYHREWEHATRRAKGIPERKGPVPCVIDGCERLSVSKGMCGKHYRAEWERARDLRTDLPNGKRRHHLYLVWFERKQRGSIGEPWLDFDTFVAGVGERPSEDHYLDRPNRKLPYGADNFVWLLHIKRQKGETNKEFWARKWQSRRAAHPLFERHRHLARNFGLSADRYEEMSAAQNDCCAICGNPETRKHHSTGETVALSVDHDHDTGMVRDLLCWRCNATIGRAEESVQLLESMIAYLRKWGRVT